MKKEWKHPFWDTAAKDRLTVRLNITHSDGSFTTSVARVSKFDENGKISKDYEEVIAQNSLKAINENTEERIKRHEAKREADVSRKKERDEQQRLEQLFNYKLQAFEIPEIKESTNRELKSRIRKARNIPELNAFATILLMENMNAKEKGSK